MRSLELGGGQLGPTTPIPVEVVTPIIAETTQGPQAFAYNEVTSVASDTLTTVLTYTASANKILMTFIGAGTNIATYTILINDAPVTKQYTYFGGSLNVRLLIGAQINMGDVIKVQVVHYRPYLGDFNSTIFLGDAT